MLNTDNGHRLMEWHRGRCRHHKTEWLPSVFRGALLDKDFYDRPLTYRLNSIHRKEQCRNDGPFRSASLRHTSFLSGLHRFSFFSVPVYRRHRRVGDDLCVHGLSSGGAFSTRHTINKWVSTSCLTPERRVAQKKGCSRQDGKILLAEWRFFRIDANVPLPHVYFGKRLQLTHKTQVCIR